MYLKKCADGFKTIYYLNLKDIPSTDITEYIEVDNETCDNLTKHKSMWQNGEIVPNPNYETFKAELEARLNKRRQIAACKSELCQIKKWFETNDWKVNKIVIGEWEKSDPRWLDYISERTIKRARQDELHSLIEEINNIDLPKEE